jgi:hypothetical protein
VPELAEEFISAAEEMAISREYLGCHYPSDSEMGRLWARKFVNELFRKEKFRLDFEAAKREILEAKKKHESSSNEHRSKVVDASNASAATNSNCARSCADTCNKSCCKM